MPQLTVILGPTASGKTSLGITMAQERRGAVVSADSRQVYAGMNIGTATPLRPSGFVGQAPHDILTPDYVDGVPHYLLNIRAPDNPITLEQWQKAAFTVIDHLLKQNVPPLLVGGTMLYIDSIVFNFDIPAVPPNEKLRAQLERGDTQRLYEKLLATDPKARRFIEPHNRRRIIRALEVIDATGKPFSAQRRKQPPRYQTKIIGVFPGWKQLRENIERRARHMIRQGLIEETKYLQDRYRSDLPLLKTLNYAQAAAVLSGHINHEEAIKQMVQANMRYTRRQMSWWRKNPDIEWQ